MDPMHVHQLVKAGEQGVDRGHHLLRHHHLRGAGQPMQACKREAVGHAHTTVICGILSSATPK